MSLAKRHDEREKYMKRRKKKGKMNEKRVIENGTKILRQIRKVKAGALPSYIPALQQEYGPWLVKLKEKVWWKGKTY